MKKRKMAIEIKEYVGHVFTNVNQKKTELTNLTEAQAVTCIDESSLMVDIEAIHSKVTRNNTYYSPECLKESVRYWTAPYERPVITHHNEKDGEIIGRVKAAEYVDVDTRSKTPALLLTVNIGDEEGKKKIKNGTFSTVSIGVIAHDLRCSICGQNLAEEGPCEHERGEVYGDDNQLCYWIINKMEPKEVSYVIVPSDIYAHNVRVYPAINKKKGEVKESVDGYNPFQDILDSTQKIVDSITESATATEGTQVDEEVKEGQKTATPEGNKTEDTQPEDNKTEGEATKEEPKTTEDTKAPEEPKKTEENTDENKGEEGEKTKEDDKSKKPEDNTDENKDGEDKSKELEVEIAKLKKELQALKVENEKLTKKANDEKKLRESVEFQLVEFKAKEKQSLIEEVNALRKGLSLTALDESSLQESSEIELKATVKQLNEFSQVQRKAFGAKPLTSPIAVSEAEDNTSKEINNGVNVKESLEDSNKNLEDEYIELFKNIF